VQEKILACMPEFFLLAFFASLREKKVLSFPGSPFRLLSYRSPSPPPHQMHVEMADFLSDLHPVVDQNLVAGLDPLGFSHFFGGQKHFRPDLGGFLIQGIQRIEMPLGYDQKMDGRFRVNIINDSDIFVFV
jgi:hypothetical protein